MLEVEHRLVQRESAIAGLLERSIFAHSDPPSSCGLMMPDTEVPCRGAVGHKSEARPRFRNGPFALVIRALHIVVMLVALSAPHPHVVGQRGRGPCRPQEHNRGRDHED